MKTTIKEMCARIMNVTIIVSILCGFLVAPSMTALGKIVEKKILPITPSEILNTTVAIPENIQNNLDLLYPSDAYSEILDLRTSYARHYKLDNGSILAVLSMWPTSFQNDSGEWQDIPYPLMPVYPDPLSSTITQNPNYYGLTKEINNDGFLAATYTFQTGVDGPNYRCGVGWDQGTLIFDATYRGFIQFDTSSISDSASILDVNLNFYVDSSTNDPFGQAVWAYDDAKVEIREMTYKPSNYYTGSGSGLDGRWDALYSDSADGILYWGPTWKSVGSGWNGYVDLGTSANSKLQGNLGANWFGCGFSDYYELTYDEGICLILGCSVLQIVYDVNIGPSVPSNPSPINGATGVSISTELSVYAYDGDDPYIDIYFYWSSGTLIGIDYAVASGSRATINPGSLSYSTTYYWWAFASDDLICTLPSDTWSFTTIPAPYITVTSPNGGESWKQGTSQYIYWNSNVGGNVKIELYKSGSLQSTITGSTSNSGSFYWSIPTGQAVGSDYKVRITSTTQTTVNDYSNNYFSIIQMDYITITSPNGGESWKQGTGQYIYWNSNVGGYVKIELYKASSLQSTITSSTSNSGSYYWNVPAGQTVGADYKIKIISTTQTTIYDDSNNYFSITLADYITITTPNGGENWKQGTGQYVYWNSNVGGNVKIELYKAGSLQDTIASSTTNSGSFYWIIPPNQLVGTDYKIKITSATQTSIYDDSNSYFVISQLEYITVTTPNGGENWKAGTSYNIIWNSNAGGNVKIELLKSGSLQSTIASTTLNDGTLSWTIPWGQVSGSDYTIKITSTIQITITDTSNNPFTIQPPGMVTITGTLQYFNQNHNRLEPVKNVRIQLWDDGLSDMRLDTGDHFTEDDGTFSFGPITNSDGSSALDPFVIAFSETDAARITDGTNVYQIRLGEGGHPDIQPTNEMYSMNPVDIVQTQAVNPAFFISNVAVNTYNWLASSLVRDNANDLDEDGIVGDIWNQPKMDIRWPGTSTSFNGNSYIINIHTDRTWIEDSITHEYSHAVMWKLYNNDMPSIDSVPSSHSLYSESSPGFALIEGWAEFMPGVYQNSADYKETNMETEDFYNGIVGGIGDSGDMDGNIVEGAVAAIIWDIYDDTTALNDGTPGADDDLLKFFLQTWNIIRDYHPDGMSDQENSITDFWDVWIDDEEYGMRPELNQIFWMNGINENTPPTLTLPPFLYSPYSGQIYISTTNVHDQDGTVESIRYEFSRDKNSWYLIGEDTTVTGGWGIVWDTNQPLGDYGGIGTNQADSTIWVRATASDGMEESDTVVSNSFAIDNHIKQTPTQIDSNIGFVQKAASEGWNGTGSTIDPYIIECYDFNGTGNGVCLYIRNTTVYFVVRNNTFHGTSGVNASVPFNAAIILQNVKNARVENNIITGGTGAGINCIDSSNNMICNNTLTFHTTGYSIYLIRTNTMSINGNQIHHNNLGIWASSSTKIYLNYNQVVQNKMGLCIYLGDVQTRENEFSNNSLYGIRIYRGTAIIEDNRINNNRNYGIWLSNSKGSKIIDNEIIGNTNRGLFLEQADWTEAHENTIVNNGVWGVYLTNSLYCKMYHNSLIGNINQAYDDRLNQWDNGLEGNYWSDYTGIDNNSDGIGDTPYLNIAGGGGSIDRYPVMNPFP